MGDVQFPGLVVCTELCALSEEFLYDSVVFLVPVDLGLGHQDGNVFLQTVVELF
jgi:hypothetical protein